MNRYEHRLAQAAIELNDSNIPGTPTFGYGETLRFKMAVAAYQQDRERWEIPAEHAFD